MKFICAKLGISSITENLWRSRTNFYFQRKTKSLVIFQINGLCKIIPHKAELKKASSFSSWRPPYQQQTVIVSMGEKAIAKHVPFLRETFAITSAHVELISRKQKEWRPHFRYLVTFRAKQKKDTDIQKYHCFYENLHNIHKIVILDYKFPAVV